MDKVVHFEIPADNLERIQKFYSQAFGWKMDSVPGMGYILVSTVEIDSKTKMPKELGAINGGILKRTSPINSPLIIVNVEDIDKSIEKIKSLGGGIIREKMKVGEMGYAAYFKDTEGNTLGIWQEIKNESK